MAAFHRCPVPARGPAWLEQAHPLLAPRRNLSSPKRARRREAMESAKSAKTNWARRSEEVSWKYFSSHGRQFEEVLCEGEHGAVHPLDFWVGRVDHVIFVGSVRAAAVAEAEMAGWQPQRCAGENITRPGSGAARPENRLQPGAPIKRKLRPNQG